MIFQDETRWKRWNSRVRSMFTPHAASFGFCFGFFDISMIINHHQCY